MYPDSEGSGANSSTDLVEPAAAYPPSVLESNWVSRMGGIGRFGRPLLLLFCLSLVHGAEGLQNFPQSCDTVRDVVVSWLKQRGFRFSSSVYRCQSAGSHYAFGTGDSDCADFTGKRIRNAQRKRIWRLGRFYIPPQGGQHDFSCPLADPPDTCIHGCFRSFSVKGVSGTMQLKPQGSGCALSLRLAFPAETGDACLGFATSGEPRIALPSNGVLEREYLSAIRVLVK